MIANTNSKLSTVAALLVMLFADQATADPGVYQHVLQSTALIVNQGPDGTTSLGSGVLVDVEQRLVLTNYHVVASSNAKVRRDAIYRVYFSTYDAEGNLISDKSTYVRNFDRLRKLGMASYAKVVGLNERADLALIQLESAPVEPQPIAIAAESAAPGDSIHSIGNPSASDSLWVYTPGQVRQVYKKHHKLNNTQEVNAHILETTSPTNPGDSGGPMVNENGELVGLVSSLGGGRLMSHAIDVREIHHMLNWYYEDVYRP